MYFTKTQVKLPLIFILFHNGIFVSFATQGNLYGSLADAVLNCKYDENWCDTECTMNNNIQLTWYQTSTNSTKTVPLSTASEELIKAGYDGSIPLMMYFEGFVNDQTISATEKMTTALKSINGINVCILDYSKYVTQTYNQVASYEEAVSNSYEIVVCIAKFFTKLLKYQKIELIRLIGHSLGAQMVGMLGYILNKQGITLPYCVGLDPARPCFDKLGHDDIVLLKGKCGFTLAMHTNSGVLGTSKRQCDMNVVVNCGGEIQPYCSSKDYCYLPPGVQLVADNLGVSKSCYHMYAVEVYINTIYNNSLYEGVRCDGTSKDTVLVGHNTVSKNDIGDICFYTYKECRDCPTGII